MSETLFIHEDMAEVALEWEAAIANMVTDTEEAVESYFVEKQMRLLVDALLNSWQPPRFPDAPDELRPFIAACNVGVFTTPLAPAIVPDVFLSLDVEQPNESERRDSRSYCLWTHGKPPDVVVEIVSDKRADELGKKMDRYGRMNVDYYVVFDPREVYGSPLVRVYERSFAWRYRLRDDLTLPGVGLSLQLWRGEYQQMHEEWLRWCDLDGTLILTGAERAQAEAQRAEAEAQRADAQAQRAEVEAEARRQAEAEVAKLKTELERLRSTL